MQFYPQIHELNDSVCSLFISERICRDKNDCRSSKKQYVFYEGGGGVYVSVYGITDQSISKKIVNLCIDAHAKNPGIHYQLVMYPETKAETEKGKRKTKTLELILRKEE
jgi:hypothetical protein